VDLKNLRPDGSVGDPEAEAASAADVALDEASAEAPAAVEPQSTETESAETGDTPKA
jgi:hypothetical protein